MKFSRHKSTDRIEFGQPPLGYKCILSDVIEGEDDPLLLMALEELNIKPENANVIIIDSYTYIYDQQNREVTAKS